jgi:hypothetical protein
MVIVQLYKLLKVVELCSLNRWITCLVNNYISVRL